MARTGDTEVEVTPVGPVDDGEDERPEIDEDDPID